MTTAAIRATPAPAHPAITTHANDEAAIRDPYRQQMAGWNQGSGAAFAAPFTEDGRLVAFDVTHFRSRAEVASFQQELFDRWLKGTRLVGHVTGIRFLSSNIALVHALGGTIARGKTTPAPERDSIQTLVATRESGEWRFVAFQNTRVRQIGPGLASVLVWALTDLLWKFLRCNKATASARITSPIPPEAAAIRSPTDD